VAAMIFDPLAPLDPPNWSRKAWMSVPDADLLERAILRSGLGEPLRVFEWGGGRSTFYFTAMLQARGRAFSWTTIEHNAEFADSLRPYCSKAVVRHVPIDDGPERYVDAIADERPHLAIVDGRFRRRCLLAAAARADVVVLHDAQRPYYHDAFSAYTFTARVGDMLWIGTQNDKHLRRILWDT